MPQKIVEECLFLLKEDSSKVVVKHKNVGSSIMQDVYSINWVAGFTSVQNQLADQIINGTIGAHHGRVMRVLRQKGFLQDKDLSRMCVLPKENISSILNRLMVDGLVEYQEFPSTPE